jgi:hypothetical protein
MVIVANGAIFGGGPYSVAGSKAARMVGRRTWPVSQIRIAKAKGGARGKDGVFRPSIVPPFMPERITDPYHPGGNSICYTLQTAHLMGASKIYLLGFTLVPGSGYDFGRQNPVTRRDSVYDVERAMEWLRWFAANHPGRVKLWPGWPGPLHEVFDEVDEAEEAALLGSGPQRQPDSPGQHGPEVELFDLD